MTPDRAGAVTDWPYALANVIRLLLVELLAGGEMTSGDLAAATSRSTALASHHLGLLAEGGVAKTRTDGWYRFYSLIDPHVADGILTLAAHGVTFRMTLSSAEPLVEEAEGEKECPTKGRNHRAHPAAA